jgi:hypothetical protein
MTSAEILEWVTGWPWPVLLFFVLLVAGGIGRIMHWDKDDLSEQRSSVPVLDNECSCQCK